MNAPTNTRRDIAPTVLLAIVLVGAAALARAWGGYYLDSWGMVAAGLAILVAGLAANGLVGLRRTGWIGGTAVACLAAYAAWSYASIGWAANAQAAWDEANRTAMYLAALLVGLALAVSRRAVVVAVAAASSATAVVALAMLAQLPGRGDAAFLNGRLLGDVGYHNGQAALLLVPIWGALALASSRRVHWLVRGLMVGSIAVCSQVAVLPQSRGAALAFVGAAALWFVVSPMRLRSMPMLAIALAPLVLGWSQLSGVYEAWTDGEPLRGAIVQAAWWIAGSSLVATVVGAWWSLVDRRVEVPRLVGRVVGAVVLVAAVVLVVLGSVEFVDRFGTPTAIVADAVEQSDRPPGDDRATGDSNRFQTFGAQSNAARIVLWRVALRDLREEPLRGVGAGNYEATYYQHRRRAFDRYVRQPHNLTLEALSERGWVGGLLLWTFVVAVAAAVVRWRLPRVRREDILDREGQGLLVGIATGFAAWFAHAQVDWLWQLPAVTIPVFVGAGMVLAAPWQRAADEVRPRGRVPGWLARVPVAVAFAAVAVSVLVPWTAERYLRNADRYAAANDAPAAARSARAATRLTPGNPGALQAAARYTEQAGDEARAGRFVERLIEANPDHYAAYLHAAEHSERAGDLARARDYRARMHELNPLDPDPENPPPM